MAIDKQNSKPFWDFTKGHAQDLLGVLLLHQVNLKRYAQ